MKKTYVLSLVALFLMSSIAFELFALRFDASDAKDRMLASYVESALSTCKESTDRPHCYDTEIPKFMDVISMEEAFTVAQLVQDRDTAYLYCHVLGHNLSAQEAAKDPSSWKDVITRCPLGVCANGCQHGAFQERFRVDYATSEEELVSITEELEDVCEARGNWNPSPFEKAHCYHGLGHLAVYVTNADLNKALALCDAVAFRNDEQDHRKVCYDGLFMQVFQPLEPEDFTFIEKFALKEREDLAPFCSQFSGVPYEICWQQGWPLLRATVHTPEGTTAHCDVLKEDARRRCYELLFYVEAQETRFDTVRIREYCGGMGEEWRGICFADTASSIVEAETDLVGRSIELCNYAALHDVENACFDGLLKYATYYFHSGSQQMLSFCATLPSPRDETCKNLQ